MHTQNEVKNEVLLDLLELAPVNKWIALSQDACNIVAVGESFSEVSILSELAGFFDPLILKTPEHRFSLSV